MELSLFSVSYAGLWGQEALDLPAFIARAARLGYRSVMLMGKRPHLAPFEADERSLAALRQSLGDHEVRCRVLAGYTDFASQRAGEVPFVEMQVAYVAALCRAAASLEVPLVRVFTCILLP